MNFSLIGNIIASGKSTLIMISLYNELELSDKIETATEPFINTSLDEFYTDLKNNSFMFQCIWQL